MKFVILSLVLLLPSFAEAQGQEVEGYRVNIYSPGGNQPITTFQFLVDDVECGIAAPPVEGTTVNPNRAVWNDPDFAPEDEQVCAWSQPTNGPLFALPMGRYEATIVAYNSAGSSPESNRALFTKQGPPVAPAGFRLVGTR